MPDFAGALAFVAIQRWRILGMVFLRVLLPSCF